MTIAVYRSQKVSDFSGATWICFSDGMEQRIFGAKVQAPISWGILSH
jgi:hypothetical protein